MGAHWPSSRYSHSSDLFRLADSYAAPTEFFAELGWLGELLLPLGDQG